MALYIPLNLDLLFLVHNLEGGILMKWGLTPTENGLVRLNLCGRRVCLKFESYTFLAYLHNGPQSIYTYMYNIDINPKSKPLPGHGKKTDHRDQTEILAF